MSSFAEFCIIALASVLIAEIYASISDLSLDTTLPIGGVGRIGEIGILLTLNEFLFIKYIKKVAFRKQLSFNDDFVGIWLEITNFVIAICLAGVMTYGADYVKYYENPFFANLWPYYHSIKYGLLNTLISDL